VDREIAILQALKSCPQIIKLVDTVIDPVRNVPSIATELVTGNSSPPKSEKAIKSYM
jgi:serine/threonine protein kinase